jgi:hypothetical protein
MSDERFEQDLRSVLRSDAPKEPPVSLVARVASITVQVVPDGATPWRRGRLTGLAAAAALVLAVGGLLLGALALRSVVGPAASPTATPSPSPASIYGGPLTFDFDTNGSIGLGIDGVDPNVPFVWGYTRLYDPGPEAAVLDSVALVGATPGLRVVAVGAFPLVGPQTIAISGQPVPASLLAALPSFPVEGATVVANTTRDGARSTGLAFVLSVPTNGRYLVDGLRLRYHIGAQHYQVSVQSGLDVCAGATLVGLETPSTGATGSPEPVPLPSGPFPTGEIPYCPYGTPPPSASPAVGR